MRSMIAALVLFSSLTPAAQAGGMDWLTQYKKPNIHIGQLQLHPYYKLSETYDTNIYLVPRDQPGGQVGGGVRSSWITKNFLGLETLLPARRLHAVAAGYEAEFQNYSTQPEINDTINQKAHLDYTYAGAYGLTFQAGDQYINTNDQAFSQLIDRFHRWSNRLYTALDYAPEGTRFTAGVDASHTVNKYVGAQMGRLLNRYEQRAGFNIGYRVMPKTRVYAAYHRSIIHYTVHRQSPADQDRNNKSHNFDFGLSGVITPRITGKVEAGTTVRKYDEPPVGASTKETKNLTVSTNLVYKPTDRTDIALTVSRYLQESISDTNRFYIRNDASLDVKHKLPYKFSVGGNIAWGLDKYPDTQVVATGARGDRRDDIYQGGAWVEYDIQEWLSTGLAYVYRERNSTFTGQFNYEDQQTIWNLAVKF